MRKLILIVAFAVASLMTVGCGETTDGASAGTGGSGGTDRDFCAENCPDLDLNDCDTAKRQANQYCEGVFPTQDRSQCIEQRISLCLEQRLAGPTCETFCERVVVDCDALLGVTRESCIQWCECDLQSAREISAECGEAQEKGFLCTSELDCQGVFDFFSPTPPDDSPCRSAVLDVIAACEG